MAYTHLTYEERLIIADRLKNSISIKSIALELSRSTSTISREIKGHTVFKKAKKPVCVNYRDCTVSHLCKDCTSIYKKSCRKCGACIYKCPDYKPYQCDKLAKSPYVCNSCNKISICSAERRIYDPKYAQNKYKRVLSENRSGFDLSEEELNSLDEIIKPLIKKGQSPYHILQANPGAINVSESTLRRIINSQQISVRNIDLRVQVKRKARKHRHNMKEQLMINKSKQGHLWKDFIEYTTANPDAMFVEMDTVEGLKDENAVLLTLHFPVYHMQLAIIIENQTSVDVVSALDMIEEVLGTELFTQMFPVLLTDNGKEFSDVKGMETSIDGKTKRTTVFFCEPNRSDEKGHCEKNHTHIRYVIPKGTSIEHLNQSDVTLMMNHINSYKRKTLGGRCPYEMATFMGVHEDFFILLGLELIPPLEVNLTPGLLK